MLRIAYAANIAILVPVAAVTIVSRDASITIFEGKFTDSTELRVLVGCLWAAILACSIVGLAYPQAMIGILLLQVVYKGLFLALVLGPLMLCDGIGAVPWGLTISFVGITLVWPFLIWHDQFGSNQLS
jgi:hypothetical protein